MENLLVAVDGTPGSFKGVRYVGRMLRGIETVRIVLCHVLPGTSPNLLPRDQVQRVERMQEEYPHLSGLFWDRESEEKMERVFQEAREILVADGFGEQQIRSRFAVRSGDAAEVIVKQAEAMNCPTIVIGRRGLSRVQEILQGSTSGKVTRLARSRTVWVVD